jgi:hypothetical protein
MTCLNTAANLGGTWPSSVVMYLVGLLTIPPTCHPQEVAGTAVAGGSGGESVWEVVMRTSLFRLDWGFLVLPGFFS